MRKVRTFKCTNDECQEFDKPFDVLVEDYEYEYDCPHCGELSIRIISTNQTTHSSWASWRR